MFFFCPHLLQKGANIQKKLCVEKTKQCFFSFNSEEKNFKIWKKRKIHYVKCIKNRFMWCFLIFDNFHFFNHFLNKRQGILFNALNFCIFVCICMVRGLPRGPYQIFRRIRAYWPHIGLQIYIFFKLSLFKCLKTGV